MKRLALALILVAGPTFADEPSKPAAPEPPKPVLTADEGRKLYELGIRTGMAQAAVQSGERDAKGALEKAGLLQPAK